MFTLSFVSEEGEQLVFNDWSTYRATEELTAVRRLLSRSLSGDGIDSIQRLITEKSEQRAVIAVGSRLGDHVDGRALRSSICGREALGADGKLLHGFQRKLHDRATDGAVLIVDSVYGDVHIAAVLPIDRENRVPALGGVVRVRGLNTGNEVCEVGYIPPDQRKFLHFRRGDILAHARLGLINQEGFSGYLDDFIRSAGLQLCIDGCGLSDHQFHAGD